METGFKFGWAKIFRTMWFLSGICGVLFVSMIHYFGGGVDWSQTGAQRTSTENTHTHAHTLEQRKWIFSAIQARATTKKMTTTTIKKRPNTIRATHSICPNRKWNTTDRHTLIDNNIKWQRQEIQKYNKKKRMRSKTH